MSYANLRADPETVVVDAAKKLATAHEAYAREMTTEAYVRLLSATTALQRAVKTYER